MAEVGIIVPMTHIKKTVVVEDGTKTYRQVMEDNGQQVSDLHDIIVDSTKSAADFPDGYDTIIQDDVELWGLVNSDGGLSAYDTKVVLSIITK